MITILNGARTLTKHISWDCKFEFDSRKYISNQKWKNNTYQYQCKRLLTLHVCKEDYAWCPSVCSCAWINNVRWMNF